MRYKAWFRVVWGNFQDRWNEGPAFVKPLSWITLLVFSSLWFVSFFFGSFFGPEVVRYTGVILQFSGFISAALGLEVILEKFGRKPSTKRFWPWVRSFADIFDTTIQASFSLTDSGAEISAKGLVEEKSRPLLQSMGERLRHLEQKLKELDDDLETARNEFSGEIERLEEAIQEEREARKQRIQDVEQTFEEANVGEDTLNLEWWGVSLLIYGLLLSSFPFFFGLAHAAPVLLIPFLIVGSVTTVRS